MTQKHLLATIAETERFLRKAKHLASGRKERDFHSEDARYGPDRIAVLRSSMDLSKELAQLRKTT